MIGTLAGCNVGPKYKRPTYQAPPAFRGADEAAVASDAKSSLGDQQWAGVYQEPELQELIRKALANNYDVRIAAQRITEQQAQVQITRSQQFPTVSAGGTGVGATFPTQAFGSGSNGSGGITSPISFGSFNLSAAWTPDFWGLYRKQTEAAAGAVAGTDVGAARGADDAGAAGGDGGISRYGGWDRQLEISKETLKIRQDSVKVDADAGEWRVGAAFGCAAGGAASVSGFVTDSTVGAADSAGRECDQTSAGGESGAGGAEFAECVDSSSAGFADWYAFATSGEASGY